MNDLRGPALFAATLSFLCTLTPAANAEDEAPRTTIDAAGVMEMAVAKNPSLAAAVSDVRRAQLLEEAEDHRYVFTLLVDGKATRNGAPTLGPAGVNFPESTTYSLGGELRRKLVWGTDLSLRLEGTRQASSTLFSFVPPGGAPVQTLFQLGPGYGGSVRLGLTQPLLRGAGRDVVLAQLDAAKVSRTTATFTRDRTASQLLLDALTAYWELYYASRAVDIQRRSLALAREQRDETAARMKTGSVAPVELLTFESRIATLEEDLVAAEAEERRRSTALGRLVGDADLTPRRAADREPARRDAPSGDVRRRAIDTSPEIAEQRSAVELAEIQARTAADPLRARLDLDAYVQANGLGNREVPPVFEQLGALKAITAQVGLTYEAPLDDSRRRAEHDRAQLAVTAAKQRLDATTQKVLADLDDADQRRASAARRIDLSDRTLTISKSQLDAERARFRTGAGTALEVRVAEDQARTAELRTARARVDLAVADLALLHLSGGLVPHASRSHPPPL
jgi:outer membrane protein